MPRQACASTAEVEDMRRSRQPCVGAQSTRLKTMMKQTTPADARDDGEADGAGGHARRLNDDVTDEVQLVVQRSETTMMRTAPVAAHALGCTEVGDERMTTPVAMCRSLPTASYNGLSFSLLLSFMINHVCVCLIRQE